jgi:hypothetical protein
MCPPGDTPVPGAERHKCAGRYVRPVTDLGWSGASGNLGVHRAVLLGQHMYDN